MRFENEFPTFWTLPIKHLSLATQELLKKYSGLYILEFDKNNKVAHSYWIQYYNSEKADVSTKTEDNMKATVSG